MKPSFKHSWMIVVALLALTFGALGVTPRARGNHRRHQCQR